MQACLGIFVSIVNDFVPDYQYISTWGQDEKNYILNVGL
jgi:hypothetical protein